MEAIRDRANPPIIIRKTRGFFGISTLELRHDVPTDVQCFDRQVIQNREIISKKQQYSGRRKINGSHKIYSSLLIFRTKLYEATALHA